MDADKKGGRRYVDEEEAGSSASHGISSSSWSDTSFPNCVKCMTEELIADKVPCTKLIVRGSVLQESKIQLETVYQKQQETLIVWSEGDSDLALSFQEKEGCDEIWEKICQVQGKDPSVDITQDVGEEEEEQYEEVQDFSAPVELPPCELSKLEEIAELVASVLPSPLRREKLANALEQEKYIQKLLENFRISEDLENIDGLHHLNEIFKALFMLNKNTLFEIMFLEENIFDVIGVLEYDPNKKERTRHREFLREKVQFKEVIPITNKELLQKIHQTYRVQYIQDILVPVPSVFEDNMSTLGSFIFFNKIEIVNMIQEDERFLTILFQRLTDDEISDEKRRQLVLFLKELCSLSQTLQQHNRDTFLKALSAHGLLPTLETLINLDDEQMKGAIVDILCCVSEYSPSMVREFFVKEANKIDEDSLLINMLIDLMICGGDSSMSVLLLCLLRMLLDPENMGLGTNKMEKSEFLSFFYKHSMHILTAPLFAVTSDGIRPIKDDFKTASTLDHIVDILSFCVEHHTYHIKNYILNKDLLRRVLVLMRSSHKFVSLAALRFCRKIIGIKDEFYNRYITKGKLLEPIINALKDNGERYNLLNSAIIELFEFIRMEDIGIPEITWFTVFVSSHDEDIKSLCTYINEAHMETLDKVDYVQTFKGLKLNYDKEQDRISRNSTDKNTNHGIIHINSSRFKRDVRDLDEDEEIWFDSEEDDLIPTPPVDHHVNKTVNAKLKDVDLIDSIPLKRTASSPPYVNSPPSPSATNKRSLNDSPPKTTPVTTLSPIPSGVNTKKLLLGGLVDYPDDDEDESENSDEDVMSPAKKPRIDVTS